MDNILDRNPGYGLEVGMLFMADAVSKSSFQVVVETDEEIAERAAAISVQAVERGLHANIGRLAAEVPVNLAVARAYLGRWATRVTVV